MITKEQIIKKLELRREKIRSFGVKKLMLVGSYAQDKANKNSDIDFVVEFKTGRGLFDDFIHLNHFLEDLFHHKIDLIEKDLIREELKEYILGGEKLEAKV
ncbi:nucleotidyltransferase domain-containing protein [Candidatus Woesearchaeota archaeon]|nr:nucleotidyltransferase domain-containing protein [Candidatus Woesearchaeota archaeon]